jgi:hypothetical protein
MSNENEEYIEYGIPQEFQFLERLIYYRMGRGERPAFSLIESWSPHLQKFILKAQLKNEDEIMLLLIALAPHVVPELFDRAIPEEIKSSTDFPEIGGVRGKNFRGFLPTGQTAVYLLAGDDRNRQMEIEQMFWSDREFSRRKILWLEDLPQGEPALSGRIILAHDYIEQIIFGNSAPPHFSSSFPARRIKTYLRSKDIMMNNEIRRHYRSLKEWIDFNPSLMGEWKMSKRLKKGYRVLFYGPPGTGKTLTATVLGNETGKEVYKIDLSMIVSKYIGETEKNLELLFARAEDKDWILLFDEADAIFGKRTSVKDAHDKYANQEVSYLLQRIEEFNGLVILATNMKNNIDDAFIRRFNDIVKFSIPNEEERKEIWEKSFPEHADYGDIPNQVKKYEISGGNIINTIHFAGIQAVKRNTLSLHSKKSLAVNGSNGLHVDEPGEDREPGEGRLAFYLDDIIEGIKREMIKEGKPFSL